MLGARMSSSLVVSGDGGGDMPEGTRATDGRGEQETGDGGYFASLAPAGYLRLTTFTGDGIPISASVPGVVDGDRAYFRAWNRSGTVNRLRHTDAAQVTPCGALGFSYGPPLDAMTRPLSGEEISPVAELLDSASPARRRLLSRLFRRRAMYYELLADEAEPVPGRPSEGFSSSLITRVRTSHGFIRGDAATPTSLATVCAPAPMSRPCPSGYLQVTTVSMSLPASRPAGEAQADRKAVPPPAAKAGDIPPSGLPPSEMR
jgi:PPOX class probable F420-dependent enzyme